MYEDVKYAEDSEAVKRSPLDRAMSNIGDATARIVKRVDQLESRLQSLTTPTDNVSEKTAEPHELGSPVVSSLRETEKALRDIERRLGFLYDALEV